MMDSLVICGVAGWLLDGFVVARGFAMRNCLANYHKPGDWHFIGGKARLICTRSEVFSARSASHLAFRTTI